MLIELLIVAVMLVLSSGLFLENELLKIARGLWDRIGAMHQGNLMDRAVVTVAVFRRSMVGDMAKI